MLRDSLARRRAVDGAYEPLAETIAIVGDGDVLTELEDDVAGLPDQLRSLKPDEFVEVVTGVGAQIGKIEGTIR